MIIADLATASRYLGLHAGVASALRYLAGYDFSKLTMGRHDIDGDRLFLLANSYATKDAGECKLEGHRKYIDVQYVVSGSELVGYAPLANQPASREYDSERDYALFDGDASFVKLEAGMVAIFFPEDLHMPGVGRGQDQVVKIVMKVKINGNG